MPHKKLPKRHSIRLPEYDYSSPGVYYVTLYVQERKLLFGEIVDGEMRLNDTGEMVQRLWLRLPNKFPGIQLDEYIVMPNHLHGVVKIVGADPCVRPEPVECLKTPLPKIIQWLKTMTTNAYIRGVKKYGWPQFPGKLWQWSFYEHVIRNEDDLNSVREYIVSNPLRWSLDRENPDSPALNNTHCQNRGTGK